MLVINCDAYRSTRDRILSEFVLRPSAVTIKPRKITWVPKEQFLRLMKSLVVKNFPSTAGVLDALPGYEYGLKYHRNKQIIKEPIKGRSTLAASS